MFADEIRRALERAGRAELTAVSALLWRALAEGQISEAEAEALSELVEVRRRASVPTRVEPGHSHPPTDRAGSPRRAAGSRPRTDASMERRRRWAASGRLPPGLAARFTLAEQAALALVAAEVARRKDCRMAVGQLAAIAGIAETTVRNAIREARRHGLVTVEERRITGFRNDTNIVRIVSPEWLAWLRLGRRSPLLSPVAAASGGGGCKSTKGTHTQVLDSGKTATWRAGHSCRTAERDPNDTAGSRIRAGGTADRRQAYGTGGGNGHRA